MLLLPPLLPPPLGALLRRAEAEGARARKGSSHAVCRLPRGGLVSQSKKWKLPEGDLSSGVLGVESDEEAPSGRGRSKVREEKAAKHSAEGLPMALALARGERAQPSDAASSSLQERPITAGSRLRVWRSLRLERLLHEEGEVLAAAAAAGEAADEHEKTLLSRLCADIPDWAGDGTAPPACLIRCCGSVGDSLRQLLPPSL